MKIRISGEHSTIGEAFGRRRLPSLRLNLGVVVGLVGAMGLALPETVLAGAQTASLTIRVRVDNYTQASHDILAEAEREASRIFGEAGLKVVWLDCPPGHSAAVLQDTCQEPSGGTDLSLRILPTPRNKFQDTVFGFAAHPGLASVYYDRVLRLAKSDNAEFELPIILGSVIAHEIGHLLLGSNSHCGIGIMQPRWGPESVRKAMMGTLTFTPEQTKLIQAEMQTRMRLHTSSLKEWPAEVIER